MPSASRWSARSTQARPAPSAGGGAAGTWFFVDPREDLAGLFFTHVFLYGNRPGGMADLTRRFMKMTYQALV